MLNYKQFQKNWVTDRVSGSNPVTRFQCWLEWCTAVCSLLVIVILLFNLLFRSVSSFRGVRRTAVQMSMLRGSPGGSFPFHTS